MADHPDIGSLSRGECARIIAIDPAAADPVNAARLRQLGFDEGVDVELLHRAPFGGDPLAVRVGNMVVAVRRATAALVRVQPLPGGSPP